MSEFDKHWDYWVIASNCTEDEAKIHFKAGQQSQQAKIDELQGRIDRAIGSLKLVNHALLYEHIDHIINLLDGTTNEQ